MKNLLSPLLLISCLVCFAQTKDKDFNKLLKEGRLNFTVPDDLTEQPHWNLQKDWSLAFASRYKEFEIRYLVNPLKDMVKSYEQSISEGETSLVNPNNIYMSTFELAVFNASGSLPEWSVFEEDLVREEFNAGWGATASIVTGKEFAKDYSVCKIIGLHKDDQADVLIFFLAKNEEVLGRNMIKYFHQLKFD